MNRFKTILVLFAATNMCGCILTSRVVNEFGVKRGTINDVNRISGKGDDYLFEFCARDFYRYRDIYFWKRISSESLFSHTEYDVVSLKPVPGHIPEKMLDHVPGMPGCVIWLSSNGSMEVRDACANKKTRINIGKDYTYKSPWRPVLLPVMVPAAFAADVIISPLLLGYLVKCQLFGCTD